MTKPSSLFSAKPAAVSAGLETVAEALPLAIPTSSARLEEPSALSYPKPTTRAERRVVTASVAREAFRRLARIVAVEDAPVRDLLTKGLSAVLAAREALTDRMTRSERIAKLTSTAFGVLFVVIWFAWPILTAFGDATGLYPGEHVGKAISFILLGGVIAWAMLSLAWASLRRLYDWLRSPALSEP